MTLTDSQADHICNVLSHIAGRALGIGPDGNAETTKEKYVLASQIEGLADEIRHLIGNEKHKQNNAIKELGDEAASAIYG